MQIHFAFNVQCVVSGGGGGNDGGNGGDGFYAICNFFCVPVSFCLFVRLSVCVFASSPH